MTSTWKTHRTDAVPHPFALSSSNDELVIISGIGGHRADGTISESVQEQTREALRSIQGLLALHGSDLSEIVYLRPVVTSRELAQEMDEVISEVLPGPMPAAGALCIVGLADERMKMELEIFAVRGARLEPLAEPTGSDA